jgi:hypothetical protein
MIEKGRDIDGKFAVSTDGKIYKKSNGEILPADEPLFLMRARDWLAVRTLEGYRELSIADGCNDYHFSMIDSEIARFKKFKEDHPERMKQPSITRGQ